MSNEKQTPPTPAKERETPAFVKSREAMTRNMSMRDNEIRDQLRMSFNDPLHVPKEMIPPEMEYHWARDTYRNEPDPSRIMALEKRGWTIVPADRHPTLTKRRHDDRDKYLEGYHHYRGLILMERPKRWGDIEREMEAEACYETMVGLPGMNNLDTAQNRQMGVVGTAFKNQTAIQTTRAFKE